MPKSNNSFWMTTEAPAGR